MRRLGRLTRRIPDITGRRNSSYFRETRRIFLPLSSFTETSRRNPSSASTRAIASFSFDHGTSVVSLRARLALRMRVRRSAMGSVIISGALLPGCLDQSRNLPLQRELAQTDAAQLEAAEEGARTPAQRAAVVLAHAKLGLADCL